MRILKHVKFDEVLAVYLRLKVYLVLSIISLESHEYFLLSRLISFVALGHSSVDRVVNDKLQY